MVLQLRAYYQLTKPGIIRGNALHVVGGALFGCTLGIEWKPFVGVLIGTCLVIASACVVNNYMDRDIDSKMKRTRTRPSVTGQVSITSAIVFASLLLFIGFAILILTTNIIVAAIGIVAYVSYVWLYGWAKRTTIHSTLVGAIPGALPAMAGYIALTNTLSFASILLFLLIFCWQMPHFYAISLFRREDYAAANLPVLGVMKPFETVRLYMFAYLALYTAVIAALISHHVVGAPAGLLLLIGAGYWLYVFSRTPRQDAVRWAKSVFGASLVVAVLFIVAAVLNFFVGSS